MMSPETPIVIMTYKRPTLDLQKTWGLLSPELQKCVIFAVRKQEEQFFLSLTDQVLVLPDEVIDLKSTRQHIVDVFCDAFEYWFLLDDDIKKLSQITFTGDPEHPPAFIRVKANHSPNQIELFDAMLLELKSHRKVATCAPRAATLPPRKVIIRRDTNTGNPSDFWSAQMVIGFNAMNSNLIKQTGLKFVSNSYGDQEMLLTFLAHGFDCSFVQGWSFLLEPPTANAFIRRESLEEAADLIERFEPYMKENTSKNKRESTDAFHNPMECVTQRRAELYKDARQGKLKKIILANKKQLGA